MELQTYYDPTGKSYYGEYGLYIFNDQNKKINKVNTFKGPLHDFSWDHKGENFIVISGFMPAHSVMFNEHNKEIIEFGTHHRNKIIWGNLGRFLCLAGFGNLNGEM
jgi:translation initiation factor 2A